MKRKIAISILVTYIPLCVAPFLGLDNKQNKNTNYNSYYLSQNIDFRKKMYDEVMKSKQVVYIEKNNTNDVGFFDSIDDTEEIKKENYQIGWLISNSNIREEPSIDSTILTIIPMYSEIEYEDYNEDWFKVKINDINGYVWKPLVSFEPINYTIYEVPYNNIKTYMPYTAITSKNSKQYKLQQIAYTGTHGIRQVNDRYCIALGSAYTTKIGQYVDLILENNEVISCILADCKADKDTNNDNTITIHDGSLVEFVVDSGRLSKTVKYTGDVSTACEEWESPIKNIIIYEESESY